MGSRPPTRFTGDDQGHVTRLHAVRVGPPPDFEPIPDSEFTLEVDLVLLAMGFTGPAPRRDAGAAQASPWIRAATLPPTRII